MADEPRLTIGWREWVSLPGLDVPAIKAKIDTGARTSALHAFDIERSTDATGVEFVDFSVHPLQRNNSILRRCRAPLVDTRRVTDSGGHTQERYFVSVDVQMGDRLRSIEMTLTQRHDMLFRMLIGRTALVSDVLVDPSQSFLCGRLAARSLYAGDTAIGESS